MTALLITARNLLAPYMREREEGQGMVEYTLIVGTISVVIVLAFMVGGVQGAIENLSEAVRAAIQSGADQAGAAGAGS